MGNMNGDKQYNPPTNYGKKGSPMGKANSAKSKSTTAKAMPGGGAKGGKTRMFGRQYAGPQEPGVSSHKTSGSGGKFGKGGGTGKVGNQRNSRTSRPGVISTAD